MTTLPEKGTKRLGAKRNHNVITLHGVEGFDKHFQETYIYISVIRPKPLKQVGFTLFIGREGP